MTTRLPLLFSCDKGKQIFCYSLLYIYIYYMFKKCPEFAAQVYQSKDTANRAHQLTLSTGYYDNYSELVL